MPSGRVSEPNKVWLNGQTYSIIGDVKTALISKQPPKVSIGPYTKDDNPIISTITWSRINGIGIETIEESSDYSKAYYSTVPLKNRLISPPTGGFTFPALGGASNALFFAPGTSAIFYSVSSNHVHSHSTATAETSIRATAGIVTDTTTGYFATAAGSTVLKPHMIVASAGGVDHAHDLPYTNWAANSTVMQYVAGYNGSLWGLNTSGALAFTPTPATTWTFVSQLPVPAVHMRGLVVAPSRTGEDESLYAVTQRGIFEYDRENELFRDVGFRTAWGPRGGDASYVWQGNIYISDGLRAMEFSPINGSFRDVGITKRSGVDLAFRGSIVGFTDIGTKLIAAVSNAGFAARSALYAWDGQDWDLMVTRESISSSLMLEGKPAAIGNFVRDSSGVYELHAGGAGGLSARVPFEGTDPATDSTAAASATTAFIVLPWLKKDTDQTWLAMQAIVDVFIPGSTQSVEISYGRDFTSTFTTLGRTSVSGEFIYDMTTAASTADKQGIPFNSLRLRAALMSGGGTTPLQLRRLTLAFKKQFKPIYAYSFMIDATQQDNGLSPRETREKLEALGNSSLLFEFTYLDALDTSNVAENKWVSLQEIQGAQETGSHESGKFIVTVAEAV